MKTNNATIFNQLGLGAFTCLSIITFSDVLAAISENIFIINGVVSHLSFWLPVVLSFTAFLVLLFWVLKYIENKETLNIRRLFIASMLIFAGLLIVQSLIELIKSVYILTEYQESYIEYLRFGTDEYLLYAIKAAFKLLKYPVFGIVLLIRAKTINVAPPNQTPSPN